MPTTTLMPLPKQQFLTNTGAPLAGGKVYTFAAGTSTPKDTFTDPDGAVKQQNPIALNARGEPQSPIYWRGNYRVEVRDSRGIGIYTVDNYDTDPNGYADLRNEISASAASASSFLQKGAGAVRRAVQEKLYERVSVDDFGAKGDGIADDTASIQSAINYVCSLPAFDGDLEFTKPKYRVTATLDIPPQRNIRLVGRGAQFTGTQLLIDHAGIGIHGPEGEDAVWDAENLVLKSNGAATYGIKVDAFSVYQKFRNLTISGFKNIGIELAKPFSCVLEFNEIVECGQAAIALRGGSGTVLIKNTVEGNRGSGYVIDGQGHTIMAPYSENNCIKNDPDGGAEKFREFLIQGDHISIIGGTLASRTTNDELPIEITGNMVHISGMKESNRHPSLNHAILLTGLYANVLLTNSEMGITDGGSGGFPNSIQIRPGVPGSFTPDILIGNNSVAGGAVVSQGSNANGRWVRYANGVQECSFQGFYSDGVPNYDRTWTYPQPFIDTVIDVTGNSAASDPAYRPNALVTVKAITTTTAVIKFSDSDIGYNVFAYGYWK